MVWKISLLLAMLAAAPKLLAQQDEAPRVDPALVAKAQGMCKDLKGRVVQACVDEVADALDYPDEYMRSKAMKRGMQALSWANAPILSERSAAQRQQQAKADQEAEARRKAAAAAALASRTAACEAKGLKFGAVAIGMTAAEVSACGWGQPVDTAKITDAKGVSETWVYSTRRAITLLNGRVALIRE
jgi:hypothetical protein